MLQRILLRAVDRHVVVAAHAGVDKLDIDVVADAFQIAVVPDLERKRRGVAAALFHRPLVAAAARVGVDAVRLAVGNIDVAAIRPPARLACRKMLVRIRDARVVLFAVLILRRVRIRIPPQPEVLDELVPLFVVAQALERLQLLVGDDPANVLVDPLLVLAMQLALQRLLLLQSSPYRVSGRFSGSGFSVIVGPCVTPSVCAELPAGCLSSQDLVLRIMPRKRKAVPDTEATRGVIVKVVLLLPTSL